MNKTIALQDKTDLQLILTYQKNKRNYKAQEILLDRYKEITYSYALKTWKKVRGDSCIEVEDLLQDYREQCLLCFEKVDLRKIKNENKFSTIGMLLNRFNAYTPVIKNRYFYKNRSTQGDEFFSTYFNNLCYGLHIVSSSKFTSKFKDFYYKNIEGLDKTEQKNVLSACISFFYEKLDIPIEKTYFKFLLKGYKGFEIAKKLKLSDSTVSNMKKKLKQKFVDYMELK